MYFFYPETAYRSLEEMDSIFHNTKNIFTVVRTAKHQPRRFGKHGEVLLSYDETEEHARRASAASTRRASMASGTSGARGLENADAEKGKRHRGDVSRVGSAA